MPIQFKQSFEFEIKRCRIEQHLFDTITEIEKSEELALRAIMLFSESISELMNTLEGMYINPKQQDLKGERSFPIRNGRYRVYYIVKIKRTKDIEITFLHIDDNKQSNLDRFPEHLKNFYYDD
jgi:hypothetical protein